MHVHANRLARQPVTFGTLIVVVFLLLIFVGPTPFIIYTFTPEIIIFLSCLLVLIVIVLNVMQI